MWSIFGWSPHFPVLFLLLYVYSAKVPHHINFRERPLVNIGPIASFSCHIPLTSDKVLLSYLTNDKIIWTNVTDLLSVLLVQSAWADFSIMMECTPKSGHCHSVRSMWYEPLRKGVLYIMYCTVSTVRCELYNVYSIYWVWVVTYGCEWMMNWKYPTSERCHIWMGGGELNLLSKYFRTTC
jgi:hypothetical protein